MPVDKKFPVWVAAEDKLEPTVVAVAEMVEPALVVADETVFPAFRKELLTFDKRDFVLLALSGSGGVSQEGGASRVLALPLPCRTVADPSPVTTTAAGEESCPPFGGRGVAVATGMVD